MKPDSATTWFLRLAIAYGQAYAAVERRNWTALTFWNQQLGRCRRHMVAR